MPYHQVLLTNGDGDRMMNRSEMGGKKRQGKTQDTPAVSAVWAEALQIAKDVCSPSLP